MSPDEVTTPVTADPNDAVVSPISSHQSSQKQILRAVPLTIPFWQWLRTRFLRLPLNTVPALLTETDLEQRLNEMDAFLKNGDIPAKEVRKAP